MPGIVLLDQTGELPITIKFDAELDGPVTFVLTGTAFTTAAPTTIAYVLLLDGHIIGKAALYANQNLTHQALRTTLIPFDTMTVGTHTMIISANNINTKTDFNDYFQVTMIY
jgi:hypothetical protein